MAGGRIPGLCHVVPNGNLIGLPFGIDGLAKGVCGGTAPDSGGQALATPLGQPPSTAVNTGLGPTSAAIPPRALEGRTTTSAAPADGFANTGCGRRPRAGQPFLVPAAIGTTTPRRATTNALLATMALALLRSIPLRVVACPPSRRCLSAAPADGFANTECGRLRQTLAGHSRFPTAGAIV